MSNAARSLLFFSYYMFGVGVTLLMAPNILLAVFGLAPTAEVWIRVVGLLAFVIGFYDFLAAREDLTVFFAWTVPARVTVFVVFLIFVMFRLTSPALALFGAIELAGAAWTWLALRQDAQAAALFQAAAPGAPRSAISPREGS